MSSIGVFDLIKKVHELAGCNDCDFRAKLKECGSAEISISFTWNGVTQHHLVGRENFMGDESNLYKTTLMCIGRLINRDRNKAMGVTEELC